MTLVERQKPSPPPRQTGSHQHRKRINREMHHPHPPKRPIVRITVPPILQHRMLHTLTSQRILQLRRRHRNTIHKQTQINRLITRRLIPKLTGHRQHIRLIPLHQLRRQPTRRPKKTQLEPHIPIHHPPPQHIHRPPPIQLLSQPLHKTRTSPTDTPTIPNTHQPTPPLPLSSTNKPKQIQPCPPRPPNQNQDSSASPTLPTFTRR